MSPSYEYQNNRIAEYAVREYLKGQDYHVVRITERRPGSIPFNLIAWRFDELIFIKVKSIRRDLTRKCFRREIIELSELFRSNTIPGLIQLWVFEDSAYKAYQIHAGGAVRIGEYKIREYKDVRS
ncbi:hypothetical protein [Methanospirillum lacunae]|nr:hypothetical protein [Methanospirillum lacunae]